MPTRLMDMLVAVSLDTQEHSVKQVRNIFSARSLNSFGKTCNQS